MKQRIVIQKVFVSDADQSWSLNRLVCIDWGYTIFSTAPCSISSPLTKARNILRKIHECIYPQNVQGKVMECPFLSQIRTHLFLSKTNEKFSLQNPSKSLEFCEDPIQNILDLLLTFQNLRKQWLVYILCFVYKKQSWSILWATLPVYILKLCLMLLTPLIHKACKLILEWKQSSIQRIICLITSTHSSILTGHFISNCPEIPW